jgi:membrane protein DedA with SNARE-associated domain
MYLPDGEIHHLLGQYGPWALAVIVGLESMGLPLPGETALIIASIWASGHDRSILPVIGAATLGAIVGDNIGYLAGREFGFRLLRRFGSKIGLSDGRIKLGQYLFLRHGAKVVFFGRFIAVLRVLAAFLAGVNQMSWRTFLVANAAGAILWAGGVGAAAFLLGKSIQNLQGPFGAIGAVMAVVAMIAGAWFLRRHEAELQVEAERALPGPLRQFRHRGAASPSA